VRRFRAAGLVVLTLAVLAVAVVVTAGALRARGAAQFGRWVGWATVAAVPVAAIGVVLVLWDKITSGRASSERADGDVEDELARLVLAQGQVARSRLIGTDQPGDRAANVRFVKGSGRFREVGGAGQGDLGSVLDYFRSLSPARLVVLGEPGAGKTVLALELLVRLLERRDADGGPVPVLISAAAYDASRQWEDWLAGHLAQRFGMGPGAAARLVRDGRVLPLVDGLDEMDSPGDPQRARALVAELNAWMRGRERAPVVVTCRWPEYQALARGVDRATQVEMLPLTGQEAAEYLGDQFLDDQERQRWQPVLAGLRDDPGGVLAGQLATPWRLALAVTIFRDGGGPAELIPQVPGPDSATPEAYPRRVDGLLLGRYVPSAVRLHDPDGRYRPEQVQRWLTALADALAWQARHNLSVTDLQLGHWWRPVGQRSTTIAHAALLAILAVPWFAAAILDNVGYAIPGVSLLLLAALACTVPSPKRLAVRQLTTLRGVRELVAGLAFGLTFGFAVGLAFGHLGRGLAYGLAVGLVLGLAFGLVLGLVFGLRDRSPQAVSPRDVIRADGRYGLALGLALGLAVGLAVGLAFGVALGVALGLAFGVAFGVAYGLAVAADVWTRYHISVVITAARGNGPIRYGAFLDWALQAGLLRVSGVAYQFPAPPAPGLAHIAPSVGTRESDVLRN
jgi:hypothetical protein